MSRFEEMCETSDKRENEAILKVLEIFENSSVKLTQTDVVRCACDQGVFLGIRKLGSLFPVLVEEHNAKFTQD